MVAESTKIIESRMSDDQQIYLHRILYIIKSIAVRETLWNPLFSEEREKVDCAENGAYMHHH
jgi:hypothetical protein